MPFASWGSYPGKKSYCGKFTPSIPHTILYIPIMFYTSLQDHLTASWAPRNIVWYIAAIYSDKYYFYGINVEFADIEFTAGNTSRAPSFSLRRSRSLAIKASFPPGLRSPVCGTPFSSSVYSWCGWRERKRGKKWSVLRFCNYKEKKSSCTCF